MADFEKHVELELVATLECGYCGEQLGIEQDIAATDASDTVKDSVQKLGVQAGLERWEMSDLGGELDGVHPCCNECLRDSREGNLK